MKTTAVLIFVAVAAMCADTIANFVVWLVW